MENEILFVGFEEMPCWLPGQPPPNADNAMDTYFKFAFCGEACTLAEAAKRAESLAKPHDWSTLLRGDEGVVPKVVVALLRPGRHGPLYFYSTAHKGVERIILVGVDKENTVLSNEDKNVNAISILGTGRNWRDTDEEGKLDFKFEPQLTLEVRNCTLEITKDTKEKVFCCRSSNPEVALLLENCHLSGSILSAVIADRGAQCEVRNCEITNAGQNGVFFFESQGVVENCKIHGCKFSGVSIHLSSIGRSKIVVSNNVIDQGKDSSAVVVRTRKSPCHVNVEISNNKMLSCYNGVSFFPLTKSREGDDKLALCEHEDCVGCYVDIRGNLVEHPKNHGIVVDSPVNKSNKTSGSIENNKVTGCRMYGIMVISPHLQEGLICQNNELVETGEVRPLFPGLQQCYDNGQCSRNVTGKRYELQQFFRCKTCNFSEENNLGVCVACAKVCHVGHEGVFLWSACTAFCDCPDRKEGCPIFDHDPKYREDKPDDDEW